MKNNDSSFETIPVSIVMPAFNAEKTIVQAIQSVLRQTHRNFELIIIDDHSKDRTLSVINDYCNKDRRIRVLANAENRGVAQARNSGVEAAKYDWIAFLDSDDMWEPEKLEKQLCAIAEYPLCSICYTGSSFIDEKDQEYGYILSVPQRITYRDLLKQNLISCSSALVKKKTLLKHPMHNDPMIHEDFATWLKILQDEPFAVGVNEPLLVYRIQKSSKSGNKFRAAQMQWRTYQFGEIGICKAIPYFIMYALRNLRKYAGIRQSAQISGGEMNG